jgi:hypothetical protein
MADVQTSEEDGKLAPVNVGWWKVKFANHGNQTILVCHLKSYEAYHNSFSQTGTVLDFYLYRIY